MRLQNESPRVAARGGVAVAALVFAFCLGGCADQEASYVGARAMDPSLQSGLGNPERDRPVIVPPAPDARIGTEQQFQWNGNPQRVIEGKSGQSGAKAPKLQPQPPSQATRALSVPQDSQMVEVQPGDTVHGIAERYGVTVASLTQANALSGAPLRVGQKLVLPPAAR